MRHRIHACLTDAWHTCVIYMWAANITALSSAVQHDALHCIACMFSIATTQEEYLHARNYRCVRCAPPQYDLRPCALPLHVRPVIISIVQSCLFTSLLASKFLQVTYSRADVKAFVQVGGRVHGPLECPYNPDMRALSLLA